MQAYENREYWRRIHGENRGRLSAVGYSGLGEGFNRAAYVLRRNAVLRLMGRNACQAHPSILEAAPGVGAYAPVWQRMGAGQWTGVDISWDAVMHCRRLFPWGRFHPQDLAAADWPDPIGPQRTFDLVTAIDVLYHLVEDAAFEAALANLAARVAPNGLLLLSDVFVASDKRIASHVLRRSLATYQKVLGPEMALVDREPVFAILADPVVRSRRALADQLLLQAWRLISTCLWWAPWPARDALGAAAVALLWPVDSALRQLGVARGVNLELALFRRNRPCAA